MKNETDALSKTIIELKEKRIQELEAIKEQLKTTYESLKPLNIIKSTLKEASSSPDLKANIIGPAIGLGIGFMLKKLLVGSSRNPIKQVVGTLIQFAVANVVARHGGQIRSTGRKLINNFRGHRNESNHNGNDHINHPSQK
jgi:hypothetical protein